MNDAQERLEAIGKIASALSDSLPGDNWALAWAIRQLAEGKETPAEVFAELEKVYGSWE